MRMQGRLILWTMAFLGLIGSAAGQRTSARTSRPTADRPLVEQVSTIADAILACQMPPGGITRCRAEARQPDAFLSSYCFGGLGLVKAYEVTGRAAYLDSAKRFVEFWMARQNIDRDRWGLVGTFYDQTQTRAEPPKPFVHAEGASAGGPGYDASDADPPIIAITAYRIYQASGEIELLRRHRDGLDRIGQAIEATLQSDGLTWSHPNYHVKYLMDVCEAWAGADALAHSFEALSDRDRAEHYRRLAHTLRRGIASLWNPKQGSYNWAKFEDGSIRACDWGKWYPDTVEQLWPMLWGAAPADAAESTQVWKQFSTHHRDWIKHLDWPAVGTVAILQRGLDRARRQTRRIIQSRLSDPNWQVNQMYFTLLNCCESSR